MNCFDPIRKCQRLSLGVRNRDQRHIGKFMIERRQVAQIEASMQRRRLSHSAAAGQGKMQIIDVKVDNIELVSALKHLLKHCDVVRKSVDRFIQTQRARAGGNQLRFRPRIATCKKGHIFTDANEFISQIGDDPFCSAVTVRRHAFV